jgi:hypothetical protein
VMAIDPNNPTLLYLGTSFLHRLTDAGQSQTDYSWELYLGNQCLAGSFGANAKAPTATGQCITAIAIAKGDSKRIYTGSSDNQVWMSTAAGGSAGGVTVQTPGNWQRIDAGLPSSGRITSVSANPAPGAQNDIIVAISGPPNGASRLWRCTNTNAVPVTWTDVSGEGQQYPLPDSPVNAVVRVPWDPDHGWFVGTDIGVFYTPDAGTTWINVTQPYGLPNVPVKDLYVSESMSFLCAATWGRGIWSTQLSTNTPTQPLPKQPLKSVANSSQGLYAPGKNPTG